MALIVILLLLGPVYIFKHLEIGNQSMFGDAISIHSLLAVVCCLFYFLKIFRNETEIFIEEDPRFIFVVGFLFFYSVGLFSWILNTYNLKAELNITWAFHNLANILKNIFFAIGLWKARLTN